MGMGMGDICDEQRKPYQLRSFLLYCCLSCCWLELYGMRQAAVHLMGNIMALWQLQI